ncbi:Golgin subfamily A member 5 [Collichthys lucidus]|uniref:Golgin subfamily A member 5 n=1 Tax=Collichthys lucidus TaxID=240159 RepID=A0A4U5VH24_COLLU|nr:Golgin subfamily A member 5 [Collichthys lucidus]
MSWFADLAGKAEDFLNKVDQGAATALTSNQARTSSLRRPTARNQSSNMNTILQAAGNIKRSNASLLAGTASVAKIPSGSGSSASSSAKTSSGFVRPKKSEQDVDDDMLFDFLNSSEPPVSSRRDSRRELVKTAVTEARNPTPPPPPPSNTHTVPSAPSTPPSTRGVSRASSMSSLSAYSVKTSEESSAREQSQGMIIVDKVSTCY